MGHADDLNRELTRAERLNVIADEQCDVVWLHASGTRSARSSAGLWDYGTVKRVLCSYEVVKSRAV
jgi:hypothetical protein